MNSLLQNIYWKAPHIVKNIMASLNSRMLERQRFGTDYEKKLREIAERDTWRAEQFMDYQQQELCRLVRHAAARVPYYRKQFNDQGIDPASIRGSADLPLLPILEKPAVRVDPLSFVDETLDPSSLSIAHTSGTTGTPLDLYRNVELWSTQFAYWDARCRKIAGMQRRRNKSVTLGGHLVTEPKRTRPPFWVYNKRWNQLYMSSYHLAPEYMKYYIAELKKFNPEYIEGIASSVYALARFIVEEKIEPMPLKACFTTCETLFDYQREAIAAAFCCRTYNQYGAGEEVVFAAECRQGAMHLSPDVGILEVVDQNNSPVPAGETGELICTSLINFVQPFIRYRIGDIGALGTQPCTCGSPLPVLARIEGRIDDVLITRDGRRVGRLDPVFKGTRGVVEAQIIQDDYDKFRVRVVPSETYSDNDGKEICANLLERIGKGDIQIEIVPRIERSAGGKFKTVLQNMPAADKQAAR
jgi:phenylacetate-CoA ligase